MQDIAKSEEKPHVQVKESWKVITEPDIQKGPGVRSISL